MGVKTAKFVEMKNFLQNVVGYVVKHEEEGFAAYLTPQGQRFEVFAENYPGKEHFTTGPVPGFEVKDFAAAVAWLKENQIEVLGDIVTSKSGTRWAHFRGPDGNVYEFVYHPDLDIS